ncbi:sugar phosphate isomerase/epimerase [Arthrobacter sp. AZCC_0090]|uniref:sugar phosphate isomerase/epimerase family protein n=1 Tax=Arthrobacter sp. AZCC_0090 TaxID=2735881 RepID=UPI001621F9CF|nr:sugar phosphate isomerase/epimerase family protein [Arthrobacter sp. AZCC_0090]MBB6406894.1 sugar phosphate isomerase/epimerase [Arthrobacter sp. AZCC_0090]
MQIGLSTYSLAGALANGRVGLLDLPGWAATHGASHLEVAEAGLGVDLSSDQAAAEGLRERAGESGIALVNYVVGADFLGNDAAEEIERVKTHLDTAHRLGISRFRHDVVPWAWRPASYTEYRNALERVVPASRELADYAAGLGITTSVENHGMAFNVSERLLQLVHAVDRENFKITLDIGNFLCVDELPESAVAKLLPYAAVVHLKDFYSRKRSPGEGWLRTLAGDYIQGSVLGLGDMDLPRILRLIKDFGFSGPCSVEYEGREESLTAVPESLRNAAALWEGC